VKFLAILSLVAAGASILALSGCGLSTSPNGSLTLNADTAPGNGPGARRNGAYITGKQRDVTEFHAIENHAVCDLLVTVGKPCAVTVQAEENVIPQVVTEIKGGTLIITLDRNLNVSTPVRVSIMMPKLDKFTNSGVGTAKIDGLRESFLSIQESGAGSLSATGTADMVDLTLSGVGNADLKDLRAKAVTALLSGTGSAKVNASQSLSATVSGIGKLNYWGNPPKVQKNVTGLGTINAQ